MTEHDRDEFLAGDDHSFLVAMNKAQLIMLAERGLLESRLASDIARGVHAIAADPDAPRPADYLAYEKELVARVGGDASNLHLGRSRNDIGATRERLWLRQECLAIATKLVAARRELLARVSEHADVVIPAYTHAVQAQPISLGHYLLALDASLARDADRLRAAYDRVNESPLGAGALATSGFLLDRARLAQLLGFVGLCENSYDCIGIASADTKLEVATVLGNSSVNIGRFCQDLVIQQAGPAPGITVAQRLTGGSSIMPQKRSPAVLEKLRSACGGVLGAAQAVPLLAHNTPFGDVADVRGQLLAKALNVTEYARTMYDVLNDLMAGLVVDADACRALVDADYSTMTELADTLFRVAGVPFRLGHAVAGKLSAYGREHAMAPNDVPISTVAEIFDEVVGNSFPLDEQTYRQAIDAAHFVRSRRGIGGPQPDEVRRMLGGHERTLGEFANWAGTEQDRLQAVYSALESQFDQLVG